VSALQLRHVEVSSPIHRLRADTKIVCVLVFAMALAFNPEWPVIGIGWGVAAAVFLLARLPVAVVGPPPPIFFYVTFFGGLFSLLSGGDPTVVGIGLGGVIEFAQFVTLSLLLIVLAALLAWTTTISEVGLGLGVLMRPLRYLRLPVDELTTVVALAVRSLPLVREEIDTVNDARRTRPPLPDQKNGFKAQLVDAIDFGATIVVGAHRRSRELAKALLARGSLTAPEVLDRPHRSADIVAMLTAATGAVWIFLSF
jgi:energy-coupling factor transport system permease protein